MCNQRKVRTDKGGKSSKHLANGIEANPQQAIGGTTSGGLANTCCALNCSPGGRCWE